MSADQRGAENVGKYMYNLTEMISREGGNSFASAGMFYMVEEDSGKVGDQFQLRTGLPKYQGRLGASIHRL